MTLLELTDGLKSIGSALDVALRRAQAYINSPQGQAGLQTINRLVQANDIQSWPGTLMSLAADKSEVVRRAVAMNPSAPVPALAFLSKDAEPMVRLGVALNPAVPPQIQLELASDSEVASHFIEDDDTPLKHKLWWRSGGYGGMLLSDFLAKIQHDPCLW